MTRLCDPSARLPLHDNLPGHMRVDRTEVVERPFLAKCVRELTTRIQHRRFEQLFSAHYGMRDIIVVHPRHGRSWSHDNAGWSEGEIGDLDLLLRACGSHSEC